MVLTSAEEITDGEPIEAHFSSLAELSRVTFVQPFNRSPAMGLWAQHGTALVATGPTGRGLIVGYLSERLPLPDWKTGVPGVKIP